MKEQDARDRQIATLRDRLSRLSDASLRVNESLDLEDVLQGVLDSARTLTDARYAVITTLDDEGRIEELRASGLTTEETRGLWEIPEGQQFFDYLNAIAEPLRGRQQPHLLLCRAPRRLPDAQGGGAGNCSRSRMTK